MHFDKYNLTVVCLLNTYIQYEEDLNNSVISSQITKPTLKGYNCFRNFNAKPFSENLVDRTRAERPERG